MGKVIAKNVVARKSGYLYYRFLTEMFKPVQWMAKEMCAKQRWLVVERRKKLHLEKLHLKEQQEEDSLLLSLFLLSKVHRKSSNAVIPV